MFGKRFSNVLTGFGIAALLQVSAVWAQSSTQKTKAITQRLQEIREFAAKLSEDGRRALSGGAQNLINLAERPVRVQEGLGASSVRPRARANGPSGGNVFGAAGLGDIPVSDPMHDFFPSTLGGFTQSETSTAWCGNVIVVGFNDSGSFLESFQIPNIGLSFNGFARSESRQPFQDLFFLDPGPSLANFLGGDPSLGCSGKNFFYASLLATRDASGIPISAISVSRSIDAGKIFQPPIVAAAKDGRTHMLDKEWLAVDPNNPKMLYVTYTDFDISGVCGFTPWGAPILRAGIELVRSWNGGSTWSDPIVLEEACAIPPRPNLPPNATPFLQDSQVVVGPGGEVYLSWNFFPVGFTGGYELHFRSWMDNGNGMMVFSPTVKITDVACVGDCFAFVGGFRSGAGTSLAVDRSHKAANGNLYIAWHDGRNFRFPDLAGFLDTGDPLYGYADILISRSSDGGARSLSE